MMPKYLQVIEYTHVFLNGYELEKVAMFNSTVVSEVEVRSWIEQGLLDMEVKPQVVTMTKKQYENLFDHVSTDEIVEDTVENAEKTFYSDLVLEQQGGIV